MTFLTWHERYSVGNADIDHQHRELFDFVNQLAEVGRPGMSSESGRILDDLIAHTVEHFKFEESLMLQIGFPNAIDHKKMHEELLKQVKELRAKMKVGGHLTLISIVRFLADWLMNHIMREDMDYMPCLKR